MLVIKWVWRGYTIEFDEFDSLDLAVRAAWYAAGYGEEWIECIEVIGDDGTSVVYDEDAVEEMWRPLEEADRAEQAARLPLDVFVNVRSPSGVWCLHQGYSDKAEAGREADRLRRILGSERVRLRP